MSTYVNINLAVPTLPGPRGYRPEIGIDFRRNRWMKMLFTRSSSSVIGFS